MKFEKLEKMSLFQTSEKEVVNRLTADLVMTNFRLFAKKILDG